MTFSYQYDTPYIWLMILGAGLCVILGIYSWRHRNLPGATGLAFVALFGAIRLMAGALELAATDFPAKVFWFQIQTSSALPLNAANLAFALEYSGLEKWLKGRNIALMAIPILIAVYLSFTNDSHHLVWTRLWLDERVLFRPGVLNPALRVFGLLLGLTALSVLIALFFRSPLHRWPAALIIFSTVATLWARSFWRFTAAGLTPVQTVNPVEIVAIFNCLIYFIVLFRLRVFNLAPVVRDSATEQMRDGMLVLDAENRIADLNGAAQQLIGGTRSKVIGCKVDQVLGAYPDLLQLALGPAARQGEVRLDGDRCYRVHVSQLSNRRGFGLGKLIMLYDISEEKRAQRQFQEQQRKLASLEEREWLARELHDGVSQTLAAAQFQVKTVSEFLGRGQVTEAKASLDRLAEMVRDGKAHVGDYLFGVKTWSTKTDFFSGLRQYVLNYSQNVPVRTDLIIAPEIEKGGLGEDVETQLQRIIQEALTNIRKHARARSARVILAPDDGQVRITIEDDGQGFDPDRLSASQGFGLRSMAGRAEAVGARVELKSSPGQGTQVIVHAPWPKERP
jgi:PAS domain S-box-containing protein